jgi:NACHT domain- and WD repeat-containing protein
VSEEASLDQQTMKICLEEIERSQKVSPKPNFIVLLGDRYGWQPVPYQIPANKYEEIIKIADKEDQKLLKKWFRCDNNTLQPDKWFSSSKDDFQAVYDLLPRTGKYEDPQIWAEEEKKLNSILQKAVSELDFKKNNFKYFASATEHEIIQGIINPPNDIPHPKEHVFCFFRTIGNKQEVEYDDNSKKFFDFDKTNKIDEEKIKSLKTKIEDELPSSNIFNDYEARWEGEAPSDKHLEKLCKDVHSSLEKVILEQIKEFEEKNSLDIEIESHKQFGEERCKFFIGREENRDKIKKYLETPNSKPFVIYGESGIGKSALIAQAVEDASPGFYKTNDDGNYYKDGFISSFIGVTPESSDIRLFLQSLSRQITKIYTEDDYRVPSNYNEVVQDFKERLNFATSEKPLFIFIDALDQFSDPENAHNFTWIPDGLPENVHIVLSTLKEPFQKSIQNRIPPENISEVLPLKKEEGELILKSWLKDDKVKRRLTTPQKDYIINKFKINGQALYLKLAFEEAKLWKSYTPLPNLKPDIPGIISDLFKRLSSDSAHGPILLSRSLMYLVTAKNGLSEDEIIDVLSRDKDVFCNFMNRARSEPTEIIEIINNFLAKEENHQKGDLFKELQMDSAFCERIFRLIRKEEIDLKIPISIWSRLYFDLEPYLSEKRADDSVLISFYHKQLVKAVEKEFYAYELNKRTINEPIQRKKSDIHIDLAEYFWSKDLKTEDSDKQVYNVRKVSELPYHETHGELWDKLEDTLTDLRFIEAKCAVGMTYDLIRDYNLALDMHPDAHEEKNEKLKYEGRVDKYVKDLIAYSKGEIDHLDVIPSVRHWSEEEIREDIDRIINNPAPLNKIKSFSQFVNSQSHKLVEFGYWPGFCLQTAFNYVNSGPVAENSRILVNKYNKPLILRDQNFLPNYNPHISLLRQLEDNDSLIFSFAITPDGNKAITGNYNGNLCIWNLNSGENIKKINKHSSIVSSLDITPDGKIAASVSDKGQLFVLDLESGNTIQKLVDYQELIKKAHISPDGANVIFIDEKDTIYIWDLKTKENGIITLFTNQSVFAVSQDFKHFVTFNKENLELWDMKTLQPVKTIKFYGDPKNIAFTPDLKKIVSVKYSKILIYNLDSFKKEFLDTTRDNINIGPIFCFDITADGKIAVTASGDRSIRIWDLTTGNNIKIIEYDSEKLHKLSLTPDGKKAITSSIDGKVFIWDLETGSNSRTINGHRKPIYDVQVSPDGKKAISGSSDKTVRIWDLNNGNNIKTFENNSHSVKNVIITPNGKLGIGACNYSDVCAWDLKTNFNETCKKRFVGHSEPVGAIAVTPDGSRLITGSRYNNENKIYVWDLETEEIKKILNGSIRWLDELIVTPDGKNVIGRTELGDVYIWDLQTGDCIKTPKFFGTINKMIMTPDGGKIILGNFNGDIFLWDFKIEENLKFKAHTDTITSIAITPDGKKIIIGSSDKKISIWSLETREVLKVFNWSNEFEFEAENIVITQNGKNVIIQFINGIYKIIDLETYELIYVSKENRGYSSLIVKANGSLVFGDLTGVIVLSHFVNFKKGLPLITPSKIWLFGKEDWDEYIKAECPFCGSLFKISDEKINTIKEVGNKYKKTNGWIVDDAWDDPRLVSECFICHEKLKFNPFIVDNSNQESS